MTVQKINLNVIPNMYLGKWVDKDGNLTQGAYTFLSQLIVSLQQVLTPEGIRVPIQPNDGALVNNFNQITVPGALLYDGTNDLLKINLAGVFHTILTA